MICTDSSSACGKDLYHPRLRATFPRVLGKYVREQKVTSLPEMIRKMTSMPAHVYRLEGKGQIKEGYDADICIFDADTIRDGNDFFRPTLKNEGLSFVIVDGKIVVEDGVYNGTRAARVCLEKR
jgi:N-acyl-D-amino-acid deacylase